MVQKFGNTKTTTSAVGLGSHEGKYTPNSSVPDLAQRLIINNYLQFLHMYDVVL